MKFKDYLAIITDPRGFIPLHRFQWVIRHNNRPTAREEAIAADVLRQANPRENITGHYPWGPEEQMVLQQLWAHRETAAIEWRDVPIASADDLYSVEDTNHGPLPVPNAIRQPGTIQADFGQRLQDILSKSESW